MIIFVSDNQVVPETPTNFTLFGTLQQPFVSMQVIIKNAGVNNIVYKWQEFTGTGWSDLAAPVSDLNGTLAVNEVKALAIESDLPQVQMVGYASGGSMLEFSTQRYWNRPSNGAIPILSL